MNPLRSCPTNLQFSLEWLEAVASNVRAGIKYQGVTYESEKPDFVYDLPSGGIDIQHESCHWILPDGRCVAWSVAELSEKKLDELLDPNARELYYAVGPGSQLNRNVSVTVPRISITTVALQRRRIGLLASRGSIRGSYGCVP